MLLPPSPLRDKMQEARAWRMKTGLFPSGFRLAAIKEVRAETRGLLLGAYGRKVRVIRENQRAARVLQSAYESGILTSGEYLGSLRFLFLSRDDSNRH